MGECCQQVWLATLGSVARCPVHAQNTRFNRYLSWVARKAEPTDPMHRVTGKHIGGGALAQAEASKKGRVNSGD